MRLVYTKLGVTQILTSHSNPQSNPVERFHRYLSAAMSVYVKKNKNRKHWEQYMHAALYVYRVSVNESTGFSPFYLLYGVHPEHFVDVMLGWTDSKSPGKHQREYHEKLLNNLRTAYVEARRIQLHNAAIRSRSANSKKCPVNHLYQVGDEVLLWKKNKGPKLGWRFMDTIFKITKIISPNLIEIDLIDPLTKKNRHFSSHLFILYQRYRDNIPDTSPPQPDDDNPPSDDDSPAIASVPSPNSVSSPAPVHARIKTGDLCILHANSWSEIIDKPWCVAKVLKISHSGALTVQQYGNYVRAKTFPKPWYPGWIDTSPKSVRTPEQCYKHYYKDKPTIRTHIPYTNHLAWKDEEINSTDVHVYGFQLHRNKLPDAVLDAIENDI
jgi:hypothetical protein